MSRVFEASYGGRCALCPRGIREGDSVQYVDDELVHADCAENPPRPAPVQPMCPECFTELPLTGVCGSCG